ncbi:MAG: hypothetical protein WBD13_21300 [Burkholderiaceae bacterium]
MPAPVESSELSSPLEPPEVSSFVESFPESSLPVSPLEVLSFVLSSAGGVVGSPVVELPVSLFPLSVAVLVLLSDEPHAIRAREIEQASKLRS